MVFACGPVVCGSWPQAGTPTLTKHHLQSDPAQTSSHATIPRPTPPLPHLEHYPCHRSTPVRPHQSEAARHTHQLATSAPSPDVWPDRHSYPDKIPTPVLTVQMRFRHALLPVQILIHSKTHSSGILQFYPTTSSATLFFRPSWCTRQEQRGKTGMRGQREP